MLAWGGGIIIEDLSQSLFLFDEHFGKYDYQIISLRKWFPIPDGGCAIGLKKTPICEYDGKSAELEYNAQKLKQRYLDGEQIHKNVFLDIHKEAGNILTNNKFIQGMDFLSYSFLTVCNVDKIWKQRTENMKILKKMIRNSKVRPLVYSNDQNAGIYYPVIVDNREDFQIYLRNNDIYAPILWPKPDSVKVADDILNMLYNKVLCIPCDHRYDERDMNYVADIINKY